MSQDALPTGDDLRAARQRQKLRLLDVAGQAGVSVGHLSAVERNQRSVTPALVTIYERVTGERFTVTTTTDDAGIVSDMRRRQMLGLVATASVGGLAAELVASFVSGLPDPAPPERVGLSEVEAVESLTDQFTAADLRFGGGLAGAVSGGAVKWSTGLLRGQVAEGVRGRLFSAVGALTDRVAWSHYDAGSHSSAERLYAVALDAAARGADRDLRGHVLLNRSTQAYDLGYRDEAVEMIRLALGDERLSSVERANLHGVCARHLGGMSARQDAQRHIGLAQEALSRADMGDGPAWARRVTAEPGHFDAAFALARYEMGDATDAVNLCTSALAALGPGRVRTVLRIRSRLAVLYLHAGAFDLAEAEAREILSAAPRVRSARVRTDVYTLAAVARNHGREEIARELEGAAREIEGAVA